MRAEETRLKGCFIIHDSVIGDNRGYFFESFNRRDFCRAIGLDIQFVQDNQSQSSRNVMRGMHLQRDEFAQAKLVRVLAGSVLDIVMDLRKGSDTFGEHISIELSESSQTQLFVPRGFAHGFLVKSERAVFFYKVDNYYTADSEIGFRPDDPISGIDWGQQDGFILSAKDRALPEYREFMKLL